MKELRVVLTRLPDTLIQSCSQNKNVNSQIVQSLEKKDSSGMQSHHIKDERESEVSRPASTVATQKSDDESPRTSSTVCNNDDACRENIYIPEQFMEIQKHFSVPFERGIKIERTEDIIFHCDDASNFATKSVTDFNFSVISDVKVERFSPRPSPGEDQDDCISNDFNIKVEHEFTYPAPVVENEVTEDPADYLEFFKQETPISPKSGFEDLAENQQERDVSPTCSQTTPGSYLTGFLILKKDLNLALSSQPVQHLELTWTQEQGAALPQHEDTSNQAASTHRKYKCPLCIKTFVSRSQLLTHHLCHDTSALQNKCKECVLCFRNKTALLKHVKADHNIYTCQSCSETFISHELLKNHIKDKHIIVSSFKCNFCSTSFNTKSALIEHKLQHDDSNLRDNGLNYNEKPNLKDGEKEKFISEISSTSSLLVKSPFPHNIANVDNIGNQIFNYESNDASGLAHNSTNESVTTLPYKCKKCDMCFKNNDSLEKHFKVTHNEQNISYTCQNCPETFNSPELLINHLKDKHIIIYDFIPFKCNFCLDTFKTEDLLKCHMEQQHNKDSNLLSNSSNYNKDDEKKKFRCTICLTSFLNKYSIPRHMKDVHNIGKKTCKCTGEICKYKSNKACRVAHKATNKSVTKSLYKCTVCKNKSFKVNSVLIRHLKNRHNIFICQNCSETFNSQEILNNHIRDKHLIVRQFECNFCMETYTNKYLLDEHIEHVHKITRNYEKSSANTYTSNDNNVKEKMINNPMPL